MKVETFRLVADPYYQATSETSLVFDQETKKGSPEEIESVSFPLILLMF